MTNQGHVFYKIILHSVKRLDVNTTEMRERVYEKARESITKELLAENYTQSDIIFNNISDRLEKSILEVERLYTEYTGLNSTVYDTVGLYDYIARRFLNLFVPNDISHDYIQNIHIVFEEKHGYFGKYIRFSCEIFCFALLYKTNQFRDKIMTCVRK